MKRFVTVTVFIAFLSLSAMFGRIADYIDPRIGSEGLGRTFVGTSVPYGMIKPSPDAVSMPNSGWAPMPEPIRGFSQMHVSGTGGGQKYGNILIMPFTGNHNGKTDFSAQRASESIAAGRYATTLDSGIDVQFTCTHGAAIYDFDFPNGETPNVAIDAGWFLGISDIPDQRETQQLVGSEIEIVNDHAVRGYNRVRGGWNNGRAYTVYFYAEFDRPFVKYETWKGPEISSQAWQSDTHQQTGALLKFDESDSQLMMKIGVSFLSSLKARDNLTAEIPGWNFDEVLESNLDQWEDLLSRIELSPTATDHQRRMMYTGLYHTMLMPSDRSGENPLWSDDQPYYDDFYAIWDTYRTSSPLITLIDPDRQRDMVNSLLNIYKRDGYMPDARSGNSNGRTQGGSNAEIVIADAFAKSLDGIDYDLALQAMLHDADTPPGGLEEAEGRGGLVEYNTLGYIPWGMPRAGNRTVEYSYCDYAIAQVAKGLGYDDVHDRFMRQSENWKNLWRDDYEHAGTRGFIMPRDACGAWLDSLPQGESMLLQPKYEYTAMTFEGPWYTPWWSMFFYEAPSWEYSLSIPHDVPGLIEMCGGPEEFERRLDTFFEQGFYNVNNEPSFLSPCLYHWLGKPWRSTDRIRQIVSDNFSDSPMGLPGNDDSGAMSSWLAFHILGLYPNAGQDYYLINSPMVDHATLHLPNGKDFTIQCKGLSDNNRYIVAASLNGIDYPYSAIRHRDIAEGGVLSLTMGPKPGSWGKDTSVLHNQLPDYSRQGISPSNDYPEAPKRYEGATPLKFVFKPHGQTRRYTFTFSSLDNGDVRLDWGIQRNLDWHQGSYTMSANALDAASMLDFSMPTNGESVILDDQHTAYMLSRQAFEQLRRGGTVRYGNADYRYVGDNGHLLHAIEDAEGTEIWVLNDAQWPIIWKMSGNRVGVNWTVQLPAN